jgi:hypothetical protein
MPQIIHCFYRIEPRALCMPGKGSIMNHTQYKKIEVNGIVR